MQQRNDLYGATIAVTESYFEKLNLNLNLNGANFDVKRGINTSPAPASNFSTVQPTENEWKGSQC